MDFDHWWIHEKRITSDGSLWFAIDWIQVSKQHTSMMRPVSHVAVWTADSNLWLEETPFFASDQCQSGAFQKHNLNLYLLVADGLSCVSFSPRFWPLYSMALSFEDVLAVWNGLMVYLGPEVLNSKANFGHECWMLAWIPHPLSLLPFRGWCVWSLEWCPRGHSIFDCDAIHVLYSYNGRCAQ